MTRRRWWVFIENSVVVVLLEILVFLVAGLISPDGCWAEQGDQFISGTS